MRLIKAIVGLVILLNTVCAVAYATMPVIDYTEVAHTAHTITQLDRQYKQMKEQYDKVSAQYDAMTGHSGWGTFQNDLTGLKKSKEWAPDNWGDALKGMAGGNPDRYKELLKQYGDANTQTVMTPEDFKKGSDKVLAESFKNQSKTNKVSSAEASYVFNDINERLENLHALSEQIEIADDVKSAIDLNSRIQIEMAYIQTEELRMMALLNQQDAQSQATELNYRAQLAKFNTIN